MTTMALEREFEFFIANQDRLVQEYGGKVLAIRDTEVLGAFDSALEAYIEVGKHHPPGTFLIQECKPGPSAYTMVLV